MWTIGAVVLLSIAAVKALPSSFDLLPCRTSELAVAPDDHRFYAAFNPTVAALKDQLLVLFRVSTFHGCPHVAWYNRDESGTIQRALMDGSGLCKSSGPAADASVRLAPHDMLRAGMDRSCATRLALEDARLFTHRGNLLLHQQVKDCEQWKTRSFLVPMDPTTLVPARFPPPLLLDLADAPRHSSWEKNWMPFDCAPIPGLCVEYSIEPRLVMRLNDVAAWLERGQRHNSSLSLEAIGSSSLFLDLSDRAAARGSAPSLLLLDHGLRLGLLHVRLATGYHHAFYTFNRLWPYEVLSRSHLFKLPELLTGSPRHWSRVQFACGMALLPSNRSKLVVSYGQSDCDGGFATIDLAAAVARARELVPLEAAQTERATGMGALVPAFARYNHFHHVECSTALDYPPADQKLLNSLWSPPDELMVFERQWSVERCKVLCTLDQWCAGFTMLEDKCCECFFKRTVLQKDDDQRPFTMPRPADIPNASARSWMRKYCWNGAATSRAWGAQLFVKRRFT